MLDKLKKLLGETLFLVAIGAGVSYLFPWWAMAPAFVLVMAALNPPAGRAFAAGTLAGSMCWGLFAHYLDVANASKLSAQIGQIFMGLTPVKLKYITASIGGLVGGFAAMTGSTLRGLISPEERG
jgi:hypothetical protein